MSSQITINFPISGKWDNFLMTVFYQQENGYDCTKYYTPNDIPEKYAHAMSTAVQSIVSLDEPWQATHVCGTLEVIKPNSEVGETFEPYEQVSMILYVKDINDPTSTISFTYNDLPQLALKDDESIAFYKHFTNQD